MAKIELINNNKQFEMHKVNISLDFICHGIVINGLQTKTIPKGIFFWIKNKPNCFVRTDKILLQIENCVNDMFLFSR